MTIKQLIKALEMVKQQKYFLPMVVLVNDEMTDSEKLEIAEAKKRRSECDYNDG